MMSLRRVVPPLLLSAAVLAAGACRAAPKAVTPAAGGQQSLDALPDSKNYIEYKSPEGNFQVTYPTGCARLHTRTNVTPDTSPAVTVRVVFVTCDRAGTTNEGCSVISLQGAARGLAGQAATDKVLASITEQLKGYGVKPVRQTPLRRDFGKRGVVEGLDIMAQRADGAGDFWIRGLLRGEDIYLVLAWKASGGLWDEPEYARFFDSFRPWAD